MPGLPRACLNRGVTWQKRHSFWLAYLVPLALLLGIALGGVFTFLPLFFVFVLFPVVDYFVGEDFTSPETDEEVSRLQKDRYFRVILFLYPFVQTALLGLSLATLVLGDWSGWERAGIFFSIPILTGGIGITIAHELGHRNTWIERGLAKLLLSQVAYLHYIVEHNLGHHLQVGTPEDASTARRGESFYRFWPRTIRGSFCSALRLEKQRLAQKKQLYWSPKNQILQAFVFPLGWIGLFFFVTSSIGGAPAWSIVPYFLGQALLAITLLELVHYVEHYGLTRGFDPATKRYERVDIHHSWNSSFYLSNQLLFQLQRHSDHHVYTARRYPALRHHEACPQLPAGYPTMVLVALVPPLWRAIVHPRLDRFQSTH